MNFANLEPAQLHVRTAWWLINQDQEWINRYGEILRLDEMDDDYILNVFNFLERGWMERVVTGLIRIAEREYYKQHGVTPPHYYYKDVHNYCCSTPLWVAIEGRAIQARMRKTFSDISKRPRVYFRESESVW
jgi:hypothetical protein